MSCFSYVFVMEDKIYDMLMREDEITWQTILQDLVKSEEMNPWDIDIGVLAKRYIETIKKMQEMNFFISGKVILASSILLKIKSDKLIGEDIAGFDNLLYGNEEEIEDLDDFVQEERPVFNVPGLAIKSPQKRKRKVSIQDLISALQKALDVDKRKKLRRLEEEAYEAPRPPEKKVDVGQLIKDVYSRVLGFFTRKEKVNFTKLVGENATRDDRIYTIIPLLHLRNNDQIELEQAEHFGEIEILRPATEE